MPQITGFAASAVPQLITGLERTWRDAKAGRVMDTDALVLQAIWREQTASLLTDLTANDGCAPIKVNWMETAEDTITDGTSTNHTAVTCAIDGALAASNKVEYQITKFKTATLKVRAKDCGNSFTSDQQFQNLMLARQVALANSLAAEVPAQLLANAGKSLTAGKLGTFAVGTPPDQTIVRLPSGNFNALDFRAFVAELTQKNRLRNPAVLDGNNLFYVAMNAANQQGTFAGDAGQMNAINGMRYYADGLNFDKASLSASTFLVDRGAVAMYTAAFGPQREDSPSKFGETRYRAPLLGLRQSTGLGTSAPVEVDVTFRTERVPVVGNTSVCEDWYIWEMKVWWIFLVNPQKSVNDGVNGIIRILNDATLTQLGTPMQKAL